MDVAQDDLAAQSADHDARMAMQDEEDVCAVGMVVDHPLAGIDRPPQAARVECAHVLRAERSEQRHVRQ